MYNIHVHVPTVYLCIIIFQVLLILCLVRWTAELFVVLMYVCWCTNVVGVLVPVPVYLCIYKPIS